MPRGARGPVALAVLLLSMSALLAEDDPIADNLAQAKARYSSEMEQHRQAVAKWFDLREEAARKKGDKEAVDRIKEERRTFDKQQSLPRGAPMFLKSRERIARNGLESAYESAIRQYTRTSQDARAAAIEKDLRALQEGQNQRPADAVRFKDGYYKAFESRLTWHDASRECERMGGRLAVVDSPETNAFLTRLAVNAKLGVVWLGASDESEEGQWKWEDDTPLKYSNWDKGQPNNVENVEHFLVLMSLRNGVWWDYPNAPKDYPNFTRQGEPGFICQWD